MRIKKAQISFLMFLFVAIGLCCVNLSDNVAYAYTNQSIDEKCAQYTMSDSPNGLNIDAYIDDFNKIKDVEYQWIGSISAIQIGQRDCFLNACTYSFQYSPSVEAYGDDNIVKIIPKELFTYANQKLYIGKEYGFYINTEVNNNYNLSTVIIIDVIHSEQVNNDYSLSVTLKPLIQLDYYYVEQPNGLVVSVKNTDGSISSVYSCSVMLKNVSNAVIPMVRYGSKPSASDPIPYGIFLESESFCVSDISFASNIYNVNTLNQGDDGYNIDDDYGYFFTSNSYRFSSTRKRNDKWQSGIHQIASSAVSFGLGFVPGLGDLLSINNLFFDIREGAMMLSESGYYNESNDNYYCTDSNFPTTRDTQKERFGRLLKSSKMLINSDDSDRIFFRSGDYATGVFHYSHTDKPNGGVEYNRISLNVALRIVKFTDNQIETTAYVSNDILFDINEPEVSSATFKGNNRFYNAGIAFHQFRFNPQYTADYVISVSPYDVDVYIDNVRQTLQNGKCKKRFSQGSSHIIKIVNLLPSKKIGTLNIDVDEISDTNTVDGQFGSLHLLKFRPWNSSVFEISSGDNAEIFDIAVLDANNNFVSRYANDNYTKSNRFEDFFSVGFDYYIIVRKTVNSSATVSVDVSEITSEIYLGDNNQSIELVANDNYKYFAFVPTGSSESSYVFLFGEIRQDEVLSYRVYDSTGAQIPMDGYSTGYLKLNNLYPGRTYYVGVKSNCDKVLNPTVDNQEIIFKWKIYDGDTVIRFDAQSVITLRRGKTYKFELWILDKTKAPIVRYTDSLSNGKGIVINNATGELTIASNRIINTRIFLKGKQSESAYLEYAHELAVDIVYNPDELKIGEIDYKNKVGIRWNNVNNVSVNYTIAGKKENGTTFSRNVTTTVNATNFLFTLLDNKAVSATFTINSFSAESGAEGLYTTQIVNESVEINCLYSRHVIKSGIFVKVHTYYISNALHLYNIRNDMSFARTLDTDIYLECFDTWEPIPVLQCAILGGGYKIHDLRLYIGTGAAQTENIGLVGINESTISFLTIENVIIVSATGQHMQPWVNVGAIAGTNDKTISFCNVTGGVTVHRFIREPVELRV